MHKPEYVLLEAVVGSQAYGLATADSDVDKLGMYCLPTQEFWGLSQPEYTVTGKDDQGDCTYHEAVKFCNLALKCNPTILELLWVDNYTQETEWGLKLRERRAAFLSAQYVRNAYLGYAEQQYQRIGRKHSEPDPFGKRTAKHARHLWRLTRQATQLWGYGQMEVWLGDENAEACRRFGNDVAEGHTELLKVRLALTEEFFNTNTPALPEKPDKARIETWLFSLRNSALYPNGIGQY